MNSKEEDKYKGVSAFHSQMAPQPNPLKVSGFYLLGRPAGSVELRVAEPQGAGDQVLLLDLVEVAETSDAGDWTPFAAEIPMEAGTWSDIEIVDHAGRSVSCEIETAG